MKSIKITLVLAVALLFTVTMSAQKFGYINSAELFQQIPEVKEAQANLETYQTQLQKKGQEMLTAYQTEYQALGQKQQQGELSPKALEVEGQKLKTKEVEIGKFQQESEQKIVQKNETLFKPIRDKIQTAIDAVAKENGYAYIFDYSVGVLIYADDKTDVTGLVKAKLGM